MSEFFKPARDGTTSVWNRADTNSAAEGGPRAKPQFGADYQVRGVIGRGGMGTVLHVESTRDGRSYALKYCRPGENIHRRFVREVRFLSDLRHPNIVPVVDARLEHTPAFYVMPLAVGSLQDEVEILARKLSATIDVFREICAGVKAIHDAGVVHRDLKPSNVLRLADGSVVVADLGAAKRDPRHSSILTATSAIVGTLAYLAPEQLLPEGSRLADRRVDLYQLGKILYQLASGSSPAVIDLDRLPVGLAHIVGRATAVRPGDRYPDVDSLLAALDVFEPTGGPRGERRGRLYSLLGRLDGERPHQSATQADLSESISILRQYADNGPREGLSWFDALPIPLIRSLARHRPVDFLGIMNCYARTIRSSASRQDFRYADFVAFRMNEVFMSSRHVGLRTRALQIVMITAVALDRYAAKSKFKDMLREVKSLALALPVSEMLRDHLDEFRDAAEGLAPDSLHPAIRAVLDELSWIETVSF
jgi:serine/threonine protein kinase